MYKEAEFERLYLALTTSTDEAAKRRAAIGILTQLCEAVFLHHHEWGSRAPSLVPFTMGGVTYQAIDTRLQIDIDQVPYLKPYDAMEFFLLRPVSRSDNQGRIAYKKIYRGQQEYGWLDLSRTPLDTLGNIFGHLLNACPPSYASEHTNMERKVQRQAHAPQP